MSQVLYPVPVVFSNYQVYIVKIKLENLFYFCQLLNSFISCHTDNGVVLNCEIQISGKSKSSGNKITGIQVFTTTFFYILKHFYLTIAHTTYHFLQFLKSDSRRVMVTSEDSKIRVLDGLDVVHKYKGIKMKKKKKSVLQRSFIYFQSNFH